MTLPVSCDPECFGAPVRLFTSLQTGSLQCMNVSENPPNFFLLVTISSMKNQEKDKIVSFNNSISQGLHTCPHRLINAWYLSFCWWECCHPKILIGKQKHQSSSVWLAQLLTVLICQIGKLQVWMQIMTETFFESNNLLNWLEQWCWWSTCCTWRVLKASGEQVASRLVVPTHHCKRQKFGGTGLLWDHLLDIQCWELCNPPTECKTSSQKEQKHFVCSFFQDWEASPALVSAAKEGAYTCQTFGGSLYESRWSRQDPPHSSLSLLKSKDSRTLLTQTSTGEIWPINLTSTSGLAYTSVSACEMQIRSSSSSQ